MERDKNNSLKVLLVDMFIKFCFSVFLCFSLLSPAHALTQPSSMGQEFVPDLLEALRFEQPLTFCNEPVRTEDPDVRERLEKEILFFLWNRPQVILWLKRTGKFMPIIEAALAERGLPDDLKYVAVVESSLVETIGSSKGARGVWQFITPTARRYALRVDDTIDERCSIFASTRAALDYLTDLHSRFNSWTLAAAGYNMGEDGLGRRIEQQGVTDYYRLYLPEETQRYVPKIVVAKMILSNPGKYGFQLNADDYYGLPLFERVSVSLPSETPVRLLADAARTDYKMIRDLNPEIRDTNLPAGSFLFLVPKQGAPGFQERFETMRRNWQSTGKKPATVYVVREGDTLTNIASRFGVSLSELAAWNNRDTKQPIRIGEELVIKKN